MRRGFFFIVLLSYSFIARAQTQVDSLRAHYILEYPNKFFIWPVLKQRTLSFQVEDKQGREEKVKFNPNSNVSLGFGVYVFEAAIEVAYAIPVNEKSTYLYGETSTRDIQANIITKKWGADVYYQRYEGFYVDDRRNDIPSGTPFPQRSDINTRNFGISGIYIFNNRKFSLRSAYNFAEKQLNSKGSWLIVGTINSFKVTADSVLLSQEAQDDIGEGSDFEDLRYTTLSIGPGYGYTVTWKNLFLNGTLGIAPAHQWVYYVDGNGEEKNDISFNTLILTRIGLGYSSDRFFGGIAYSVQSRNVVFENVSFSNSTTLFRIMFGYRFNEVGILKKRIWDYLPF